MTTDGGIMKASNLTENTADITVSDATLNSSAYEDVVIEEKIVSLLIM